MQFFHLLTRLSSIDRVIEETLELLVEMSVLPNLSSIIILLKCLCCRFDFHCVLCASQPSSPTSVIDFASLDFIVLTSAVSPAVTASATTGLILSSYDQTCKTSKRKTLLRGIQSIAKCQTLVFMCKFGLIIYRTSE